MNLRNALYLAVLYISSPLPAHAANSYRLNASASNFQVKEFSMCRVLANSSSSDYFVPTRTSTEWSAFLDHLPPGVTANNCCPAGYVLAPASSSKGTTEFCVMKWEARDVGGVATATSSGSPWRFISKTDAVTACSSLGAGYSLVTNDQWTGMMRDIEGVGANWSGGSRKSGCLFTGNWGLNNACGYDGDLLEAGEANTKARYTFSNGQQIWHLNGNVSEWVQGTMSTASASTDSSYYLASRADGGYAKMSAPDRANFGPLHDDYGTGCGGTDGTIHGNCGVGYFRITNGHAHITRGTESGDNRWDGFTVETYADPDGLPWVGFRCAYLP